MAAKKETYSQAIERLDKIVRQIDNNELDIDLLSEKIKEANEIIAFCSAKLMKADAEIEKLLEEKRQSSDINYLAEATPETLDLIKGLFLYRLAEELILYMIPCPKENGIRLFDLTSPSDWILAEESSLRNGFRYLIYHRIR